MKGEESLKDMNMGKLWSLARSRGIDFKGMKKVDLIKAIIAKDKPTASKEPKVEEVKEESPKVEEKKVEKKDGIRFVEATLADGTRIKVPAQDVSPVKSEKNKDVVIIKSVDGRELEASVGRDHWVGKIIEVPAEQEDEVKRLLTDGGFYFV